MDTDSQASSAVVAVSSELITHSLESRALKGTYYVIIFYGAAMSLRMLSSIVLSRLFLPRYFGLMALITTVIIGINLLSHVGVLDSVIQNARGEEPAFLNTAWTIQVIRGTSLSLLSIPIAFPVARFYHEPQIIALLPVLGGCCLLDGLSSPSLLLLGRYMGVGKLSALELLTQLVQFVVSVIWALIDPTIWALVGGRVVAELVRTVVSYSMLPEVRPRFAWDRPSLHELVKFGRWILVGTALTFLATQSDRLILAKLVSLSLLGVYGIAYAISDIPRQIVVQFCARIGFPFLSRFSDRPRQEFRRIMLKYRARVLAVGGLLLIMVVLIGDKFVLLIYTKPYHGAAWMVAILTIGLWHTLLYSTTSPAIFSLQKAHYNAFAYLGYCIAIYCALPVGFHMVGMLGAVIAIAASDLPVYFVTLYGAHREGLGTFRQDLWMTAAFGATLALALAIRAALGFGMPFPHLT